VLPRLLPNRQDGNYLCERGGIPLAKFPISRGPSSYMLVDIISRIKATQTTPRKPTKGGVAVATAFSVNMSGAAAAAKLEWEAGKENPPCRM
jgi:hypothetical protein